MAEAEKIEVTPSQLSRVLKSFIEHREPALIVGPPGVGKSDIVRQASQAAACDLIITHPVIEDPTDKKGLPSMVRPAGGDAYAEFLPYGDLRRMMQADKPLVVFLDDLGQAPPAVQASNMQLILAREVGGKKVSEHVRFVAATNRKQDKAGVAGILEPVKSRFTIFNLQANLDDWTRWAVAANLPVEVIAFVRFKSDALLDFKPNPDIANTSTPRTLATAARIVQMKLQPEDELCALTGAIGQGRATELNAFLRTFRSLPSPDDIIMNPTTAMVPEATKVDVMYALAGSLARKATQTNFDRVLTYAARLTPEFSVVLVQDATIRDKSLIETRAYIDWAVKHAEYMM